MILTEYIDTIMYDYNSIREGRPDDPFSMPSVSNIIYRYTKTHINPDTVDHACYSHYVFQSGTLRGSRWERLHSYVLGRKSKIYFITRYASDVNFIHYQQEAVIIVPHDTEEEAFFARVKNG
jgi:hypothetical protein